MMERFPRARWVALAMVLALSFVSGGWLMRPAPSTEGGIYQQARLFENVVSAIHDHFIDSLGEGDLYQRAAGSLVGSLHDPYAELLVDESYREYQRQMNGIEVDLGPEKAADRVGDGRPGWRTRSRRRSPEHRRHEHSRLVGRAAGRRAAPRRGHGW